MSDQKQVSLLGTPRSEYITAAGNSLVVGEFALEASHCAKPVRTHTPENTGHKKSCQASAISRCLHKSLAPAITVVVYGQPGARAAHSVGNRIDVCVIRTPPLAKLHSDPLDPLILDL